MAMTNAQKNGVSEMQAIAALLIVVRTKATLLSEIYANENLAGLTDQDFAAVASFAHITAVEFQTAAVAINSIVTALNAGTPAAWAKMLKITETMPK